MPKWLTEWRFLRFIKVYKRYRSRKITFQQIRVVLSEDKEVMVYILLKFLNQARWIDIERISSDKRKKFYIFKNPAKIMREIVREGY